MNENSSIAALRGLVLALRARFQDDLTAVSALRAVAARRPEVDRLAADLDRQLDRMERAAVITLIGATGAGKSTMLNALVGRAVAVEGVDRPTTRQPVIYAPRDADVGDLLAGVAEQVGDGAGTVAVVRYDPSAGGPWTAQILIDAPDLNSIAETHRATVTALAERSDVLVVVLHRQSVVEEASVSFVDAFSGRRRLVFVLNRTDELTPDAREDLLGQIRRLAATRWQAPEAPVLGVSARAAQAQPRAEGWGELCQVLRDLVRESAITGARRLNALGTAARLQSVFAAVAGAVADDVEALPADVAAGLERLTARTAAEVEARLALRRADLNALLWAEAAKRWDGPGGWALRVGGLSSLGLGAGALLLRRSPLLAAGAAAGSVAADQLQRASRHLRVADPGGLMPGRDEYAAWYAEGLSPARVRAARLSGDPEVLGIPPAESARADASLAVEEAWSALIERDLPAAAERSVLRFFRFVLDLPVYALAAWVVYRTAIGFIAGQYAGLDFLVNALLLLGAYLFPVRMLVRRGLSARAGRLLDQVIGRARAALDTHAERAHAAVRERCETNRAALARLSVIEATWRNEIEAV